MATNRYKNEKNNIRGKINRYHKDEHLKERYKELLLLQLKGDIDLLQSSRKIELDDGSIIVADFVYYDLINEETVAEFSEDKFQDSIKFKYKYKSVITKLVMRRTK